MIDLLIRSLQVAVAATVVLCTAILIDRNFPGRRR